MFHRISSLTAGDRRISEPSTWSLNEPFWHLRATRMGHLGSNPPGPQEFQWQMSRS